MKTSDLLKKVRQIEIKTKGLSNHIFSGEYHTAFKGKGMAFSEVREYQHGDDVRLIDWNVTARYNTPFIKIFEEEREMTVMLMVDISASGNFGSDKQFKKELATEISAVLAFSAINNNDKVGLILFTDCVEKFIPPKKGKTHILRIIRELLAFKPNGKKTDVAKGIEYFNSVIKKKSVCFILSDFISPDFKKPLSISSNKHDIIALRIYDKREEYIPKVGMIAFKDAETGKVKFIDSFDQKTRESFKKESEIEKRKLKKIFPSCGVDLIEINTKEDYVKPLINFFKSREKRR